MKSILVALMICFSCLVSAQMYQLNERSYAVLQFEPSDGITGPMKDMQFKNYRQVQEEVGELKAFNIAKTLGLYLQALTLKDIDSTIYAFKPFIATSLMDTADVRLLSQYDRRKVSTARRNVRFITYPLIITKIETIEPMAEGTSYRVYYQNVDKPLSVELFSDIFIGKDANHPKLINFDGIGSFRMSGN